MASRLSFDQQNPEPALALDPSQPLVQAELRGAARASDEHDAVQGVKQRGRRPRPQPARRKRPTRDQRQVVVSSAILLSPNRIRKMSDKTLCSHGADRIFGLGPGCERAVEPRVRGDFGSVSGASSVAQPARNFR